MVAISFENHRYSKQKLESFSGFFHYSNLNKYVQRYLYLYSVERSRIFISPQQKKITYRK